MNVNDGMGRKRIRFGKKEEAERRTRIKRGERENIHSLLSLCLEMCVASTIPARYQRVYKRTVRVYSGFHTLLISIMCTYTTITIRILVKKDPNWIKTIIKNGKRRKWQRKKVERNKNRLECSMMRIAPNCVCKHMRTFGSMELLHKLFGIVLSSDERCSSFGWHRFAMWSARHRKTQKYKFLVSLVRINRKMKKAKADRER